ncbi:MAG: flagellar assembly protein FliW [Clostridiales bacterium]|nr:flagellar assembly protein FliW [Clostridiales bacterium]
MVEINTRDFGVVVVEDTAIYDFPDGVYGFEEDKKFAIFEKSFDDVSFLFLQSVDNIIPCFLVFDPISIYPDYKPELTEEDLKSCDAKNIDELVFLVIASIPGSVQETSINLKSPIVLNPKTKKARQIILHNNDYSVRYRPFMSDSEVHP